MVCKLLFSALSSAKDPVAVDMGTLPMGTLATVEEAVNVATAEDVINEGFKSMLLFWDIGLGLIRDPTPESSLPLEQDSGDTVHCGMGLFCMGVPSAAPDWRCFPSCSRLD